MPESSSGNAERPYLEQGVLVRAVRLRPPNSFYSQHLGATAKYAQVQTRSAVLQGAARGSPMGVGRCLLSPSAASRSSSTPLLRSRLTYGTSCGSSSITASPLAPMRAERPTRCTYLGAGAAGMLWVRMGVRSVVVVVLVVVVAVVVMRFISAIAVEWGLVVGRPGCE